MSSDAATGIATCGPPTIPITHAARLMASRMSALANQLHFCTLFVNNMIKIGINKFTFFHLKDPM